MKIVFTMFLGLSLVCAGSAWGEKAEVKTDEALFQEICIPLAVEFLKLGSQLGQENYFVAEDPRVRIDKEAKEPIYDQILTETVDKLRKFIADYPKSNYADDAQVIIANILNLKPKESAIEWQKVLNGYPQGQIEKWSVKNLMYVPMLSHNNLLIDVSMLKIGEMNYLDENWTEAYKAFHRLTERYESSPLNEVPDVVRRAHFAIVRIREKEGKNNEAIAYLNQLIKKYPKSVMAPQAQKKLERITAIMEEEKARDKSKK